MGQILVIRCVRTQVGLCDCFSNSLKWKFFDNKSILIGLYSNSFPRFLWLSLKKSEVPNASQTSSVLNWSRFPLLLWEVEDHPRPRDEINCLYLQFFRKDDELKRRLLKSYRLMLDFYGIKLLDENTGKVGHAENWRERFENLNRKTHNNLRITRILKSLGILGFEHYQAPLVCFFLTETLVRGRLPRVKRSVLDYFMFSVLNRSERKELIRFAFEKFETKEEFVWCPKRIQRRFQKEINARKAGNPETHPSGSESGAPRKTPKARKQKVKRQDQCLVPPSQPLKMKKNTSCCCMFYKEL
uniref:Opioid growth factor receptor (OGFr) conserved domain-containing protein n=1 Tax=Pygocentrus nattereri TaxID=42514 RepID=A0A3B4C6V6_PYGNA